MAAVATDDGKAVTSRGWYRIDPGKCLHPDVTGQPKQIFSFAEAVDAENRTIRLKEKPLNWGGTTQLCTRESKFEINEQGDCGTPRSCRDRLWPVDMSQRRQDTAICDAVMGLGTRSVVVPANAGTHNHQREVLATMLSATKGNAHRAHQYRPRRMGPGVRRGRRVERAMTQMTTSRPFGHIDTWVFDLDNTLYPHHVNLWQQVDARIGEFISAVSQDPGGGSAA